MVLDSFAPSRLSLARLGLALVALLVFFVAPAHGDEDPVLTGVRDMLKAEMPESVILDWLEGQDPGPASPSAQQLIQLRKAGASEKLLSRILELARDDDEKPEGPTVHRAPTGHPTANPGAYAKPKPAPAPAPTRPEVSVTPAPAPKPAASPNDPGRVSFTLSYSPHYLEDEKEWDFYVYLDGKPLAYVPAGGLLGGKPLTFVRLLPAGKHELRLTRERHQERRRKPTLHVARVADLTIPLEIEPGARVDFELKFNQNILSSKNPVSYRISVGDRVVALQEDVGGEPDRWQEVCEDLRLSSASEPDRSTLRRLEDCTPWQELWSAEGVPAREQVLDAMSRFDYRPVPKSESLH